MRRRCWFALTIPKSSDLLTLSIRYQGDHHDPKDSDNELFLEMLEEPTTELIDQIIEPPSAFTII